MLTESLRAAIAGLAESFVKQLLETVRPLSLGDMLHMKSEPVNGVAHAVVPVAATQTLAAPATIIWATSAPLPPPDPEPDNYEEEEEEEEAPPTSEAPTFVKPNGASHSPYEQTFSLTQAECEPERERASSSSHPRRKTSTSVSIMSNGFAGYDAGHIGPASAHEDAGALADRLIEMLRKHPGGLRAEALKTMLRVDRESLKRAIAEVVIGNRVNKQGQKRATTYFARD